MVKEAGSSLKTGSINTILYDLTVCSRYAFVVQELEPSQALPPLVDFHITKSEDGEGGVGDVGSGLLDAREQNREGLE